MPSRALGEWRTTQRAELDRMETTVRRFPGLNASERATRQQLVDAYILLLAAHFQLYCRALHGEASRFAVGQVQPAGAGAMVDGLLARHRLLDRGNANAAALKTDFDGLRVDLWQDLFQRDLRNVRRREQLEQLNAWRNAIAHQDFAFSKQQVTFLAGTGRTLRSVRTWRANCSSLAHQIDAVVSRRLASLFNRRPWR